MWHSIAPVKKTSTILLILGLTACGGGGGGGGEADSSEPRDLNVNINYSGVKTAAIISNDTAPLIIDYLQFASPRLLRDTEQDDESAPLMTTGCSNGGSAEVDSSDDGRFVRVTYDNCENYDVTYDGVIEAHVTQTTSGGEYIIDMTTVYRDILLTGSEGTQQQINGSIRTFNPEEACAPALETYNIVFKAPASGVQIYFDNFVKQSVGIYAGCRNEGISLRGKIYDSRLGFWSVSTFEPFVLDDVFAFEETGHLRVVGAGNSSLEWQVVTWNDRRTNFRTKETIYHIDIDESGDGEVDDAYRFRQKPYKPQFFASFADSDGDGMTDTWEQEHGFDPFNAADANGDLDNDGYTNAEEFLYAGDPHDATLLPLFADLSNSIEHEPANYGYGIQFVTIIKNEAGAAAEDSIQRTTVEPPMKFAEGAYSQSLGCNVSEDALTVECVHESIKPGATLRRTHYLALDETYVQRTAAKVTSVIISPHDDPNPSNDRVTATVVRNSAAGNARMRIPDGLRNDGYSLLVVGEQEELEFSAYNYDFASSGHDGEPIYQMSVSIDAPDHVQLDEIECWLPRENSSYMYGGDCLQDGRLISGQDNSFQFRFKLTAISQDHGYINFRIYSELNPEHVLLEQRYPVVVGQSTEALQAKIDSAADGATIVAEPGVYVGPLDLSAATVHLKSAEGPDTAAIYIQRDMSYESWRLDKGSSVSGFTAASIAFDVGAGGGRIERMRFDGTDWNLPANYIRAEGPLAFENNYIYAETYHYPFEFNRQDNQYSCTSISVGFQGEQLVDLTAQNNLYVSDFHEFPDEWWGCKFVKVYNSANINFSHNTVDGVYAAIRAGLETDGPYAPENTFSFNMTNNVISRSYKGLQDSDSNTPVADVQIELHNNLFHQVDQPLANIRVPYTETGRLSADPRLDAEYQPLADSPLIDGATETDLQQDINGTLRPLDGNGDSLAVSDIGAFEYQ